MNKSDLNKILEDHKKWLIGDISGVRAYLSGADLSGAYLSGAYLSGADLFGANLSRANLSGADLSGAKNIPQLPQTLIVPQSGTFEAWKKCKNGVLVHLQILQDSKRSNATGRKCRAEKVLVLDVFGSSVGVSMWDGKTTYQKGDVIVCNNWEEDRWKECAGGIHFFLTREEAESFTF